MCFAAGSLHFFCSLSLSLSLSLFLTLLFFCLMKKLREMREGEEWGERERQRNTLQQKTSPPQLLVTFSFALFSLASSSSTTTRQQHTHTPVCSKEQHHGQKGNRRGQSFSLLFVILHSNTAHKQVTKIANLCPNPKPGHGSTAADGQFS